MIYLDPLEIGRGIYLYEKVFILASLTLPTLLYVWNLERMATLALALEVFTCYSLLLTFLLPSITSLSCVPFILYNRAHHYVCSLYTRSRSHRIST